MERRLVRCAWRVALPTSTALLVVPAAHAQPQRTGTASSNWSTGSNWSGEVVSGPAMSVLIDMEMVKCRADQQSLLR